MKGQLIVNLIGIAYDDKQYVFNSYCVPCTVLFESHNIIPTLRIRKLC